MKKIRIITVLCMAALMFICMGTVEPSSAAADPVQIYNFGTDEGLLNASVVHGTTTDATIGYKLDGISESSHTWSVDDGTICEINSNSNGRISLTGLKEGLTRVRLSVKATDGKTYKDHMVVSVYTSLQTAQGTTTKVTTASRSAHSGTENRNERANLPKGTSVSIYGKCGKYYRATVDYNFTDGLASKNAYILASDINVPVTGITLDKTAVQLKNGESMKLNATVIPAIATDKTVLWKSDHGRIVAVDSNGEVRGIRQGSTKITASAKAGDASASCRVNVGDVAPESAKKVNVVKPSLNAKATSLKTVKLSVKGGSKTVGNCSVMISGRKASAAEYEIKIGKKKLKKNSFTMKKNKIYNIYIGELKKNKKYSFKVGKKGYYSNTVYVTTGVPELTVVQKGNYLQLKWNKIKGSKGYVIYRGKTAKAARNAKKPYKTFKSEKKLQFIDTSVNSGTYYYIVKGRKCTKKTPAVSGLVIDVEQNLRYARSSPLFRNVAINNDPAWNANNYALPNGFYPPVKYRFTGKAMEIHLYLDFVQYAPIASPAGKQYVKRINDPADKLEKKYCSSLFVEGIKECYNDKTIISGAGNFGKSGVAFKTKVVIHKARKEQYKPEQKFTEVRIAGLAPWWFPAEVSSDYIDFDGDLWFNAARYKEENWTNRLPYIHMPSNAQLRNNNSSQYNREVDSDRYMDTAAHEMGHILGLDDAYTLELDNGVKVDRCADNEETCYYEDLGKGNNYFNIMKGHSLVLTGIRINDIEMMLEAYSLSQYGIPQDAYQSYKNHNDGRYDNKISDVIKNREDKYNEDKPAK